jgi:NTE family protein
LAISTTEQQFMSGATQKTAFVFAGGGSLGAVQVGMLRELMRHGLDADLLSALPWGRLTRLTLPARPMRKE